MTAPVFLLLALAGGVGAGTRYLLDGALRTRLRTGFPWPTTIINVTGSFALGVLTALAGQSLVPADVAVVLGAGFLGGYTTFSTASQETVQLVRERRYLLAVTAGAGVLLACVAVAGLGLWLGSQV